MGPNRKLRITSSWLQPRLAFLHLLTNWPKKVKDVSASRVSPRQRILQRGSGGWPETSTGREAAYFRRDAVYEQRCP